MSRTTSLVFGSLACVLSAAVPALAQNASASGGNPHTVVVRLIERPGSMPFAFEPATFSAQHGDTLRFVQDASAMHNVHFKTVAKGAKLGGAATSQYLTAKGQSYSLVIDGRFTDGTYEIVCDPHEMIGMHGFLTVSSRTTATGEAK